MCRHSTRTDAAHLFRFSHDSAPNAATPTAATLTTATPTTATPAAAEEKKGTELADLPARAEEEAKAKRAKEEAEKKERAEAEAKRVKEEAAGAPSRFQLLRSPEYFLHRRGTW